MVTAFFGAVLLGAVFFGAVLDTFLVVDVGPLDGADFGADRGVGFGVALVLEVAATLARDREVDFAVAAAGVEPRPSVRARPFRGEVVVMPRPVSAVLPAAAPTQPWGSR